MVWLNVTMTHSILKWVLQSKCKILKKKYYCQVEDIEWISHVHVMVILWCWYSTFVTYSSFKWALLILVIIVCQAEICMCVCLRIYKPVYDMFFKWYYSWPPLFYLVSDLVLPVDGLHFCCCNFPYKDQCLYLAYLLT